MLEGFLNLCIKIFIVGESVFGFVGGEDVIKCVGLVCFGEEVVLNFKVVLEGLKEREGSDDELSNYYCIREDFKWCKMVLSLSCYDVFF